MAIKMVIIIIIAIIIIVIIIIVMVILSTYKFGSDQTGELTVKGNDSFAHSSWMNANKR